MRVLDIIVNTIIRTGGRDTTTYGGDEGESELFGSIAKHPAVGENADYRHDLLW